MKWHPDERPPCFENIISTLALALSQHADAKATLKCCYTLHSYMGGLFSPMINSLHDDGIHPAEMETNLPSTVCGCSCGSIIN